MRTLTPPRFGVYTGVVLALTVPMGCSFSGDLPPGTEFTCTEDGQCPADMACQRNRQRCVPRATLDLTPPAIVVDPKHVRIKGGFGNPLSDPTAVTFGTTVEVSFSVTEPLSTITLSDDRCGLNCVSPAQAGTGYLISCTAEQGKPVREGPCRLSVELEDREGNTATAALPDFPIDVTRPPPPDTETAGRVVFRRAPWGVDGGPATESVSAAPGAVVDGVRVLIQSNGVLRSVVSVSDAGSFSEQLAPLNTADLQVATIDGAGNTSAFSRVVDGEWVATLGHKLAGDTAANPHVLDTYTVASDVIARTDEVEVGSAAGVAVSDGTGARVSGGRRWRKADFTAPSFAAGSRSVFDAARGEIINFGGFNGSSGAFFSITSPNGTTNRWKGTGWEGEVPWDPEGDGQPPPRAHHVMVYDPVRKRVVLHGGAPFDTQRSGAAGDTWAWNGESWRRLPDGPRLEGAVGFWSTRLSKMVVSGGALSPSSPALSTTWTFDGLRWEQLDAGFPPRWRALSTYSPTDAVGWMFGSGNDLWRFDGDRWSFVDAGFGPPRGFGSSLIWNSERRTAWLMGGTDVWEWDGTRWSIVTDAGATGDVFEYDALRDQVVGVRLPLPNQTDPIITLTTPNGARTLMAGVSAPEAHPAMTCSEAFGGCIRVFDGGVLELKPGGWFPRPFPALPQSSSVVIEPFGSGALALFRTTDGGWSAFELGANGTATRRADPPQAIDAPPPAITLPGLPPSLTPFRGGLLFSLERGGNVWWSGTAWSHEAPFGIGSLLASVGPLIDGGVCLSQTPLFEPILPTNYFGSLDAGQRTGPALEVGGGTMMLDPERGLTYHFGGRSGFLQPSAALVAQAPVGRWTPIFTGLPEGFAAPPGRSGGAMKYDPVNRRGVLTGGFGGLGAFGFADTWLLETASERPAAVFRVVNSAMGVGDAEFTSVRVSSVAGARGELADGGTTAGTRVALWSEGRFKVAPVETPMGSEQQPATTTFDISDPSVLRTLLLGQPELLVGITPLGTNGRGTAELLVDYVEVTVRYRLK